MKKQQMVEYLKRIVEPEQILTDFEDLYVYSFEQIYQERPMFKVDAVVKTESSEEIKKVVDLANREGFTIARRGKIIDLKKASKPIVVLDDSRMPGLTAFKEFKKSAEEIHEFHETETGTPKKLALAQKLLFLNKPATKCQECSFCSSYCTVASSFNGVETWSAKGKMLLIRGISRGELSISPKIIDVIYTCSNCGLCFAECLQHSEFQEAIRAARRQIVVEELAPQTFKVTAENILETGDPGGISSKKRRLSWLKSGLDRRCEKTTDVLYWVGCTVATRTPNTARAIVNILNRAEANFTLLGDEEGCCGYVLLASSFGDEAKENAIKLVKKVEGTRAKLMVTSCAGCYYTFSKLFPKILDIEMPCNVLHASQFIQNLMEEGQLNFGSFDARVTFHDPCALGRHTSVFDAPRNVLNKIPKLQFFEMPLNKNRSRCCGAGGGLWSYNNQVSMNSALNRLVKDAVPLEADILATACPTCQMNLRYTSIRNSIPIRVCDFAEIAEAAIVKAAS